MAGRVANPIIAVLAAGLTGCFQPAGQSAMWQHFDAAGDAHQAVIRGDLGRAQAAGIFLSQNEVPDLPPRSERLYEQLRTYAEQLSVASDVVAAANAAADMAGTCGECHREYGPGPSFSGRGVPPEGGLDVSHEMRRHAWAAGRLWEGLIGPSDPAWRSGAAVLRDAWMMPEWLGEETDAALVVRAMETTVRDLGSAALGAHGTDDRKAVYAQLITTCARCHAIVQRRG